MVGGVVKNVKGSCIFMCCFPPPCSVYEELARNECLCVSCQQWGLAPGAGRSKWRGQGSPRGLNRIGVFPLPKEARRPPRLHRTSKSFTPPSFLFPLLSFLSWSPFLFSFGEGTVIHNPLNYQQLNYPSCSSIFSPRMEIQKQLTSSRLGTFPRKGYDCNWMTPPFTFLTMTSLLHA